MNKITVILIALIVLLTGLYIYILINLGKLEFRVLVNECADLTWNSSPEPKDPNKAIEYINKCIHMNAKMTITQFLIENSDYTYWVEMPNDANDIGKFLFKHPEYPNVGVDDFDEMTKFIYEQYAIDKK